VSENLDFSLFSNNNLSVILPSSGLGLGPVEVGQKGLKVFHLQRHSQKTRNQNYIANSKTCRVFWRFEQHNWPRSYAICKDTYKLVDFRL